jgi:transposase
MSRHNISDEKWAIIGPLLVNQRKDPRGRKAKDDRQMFNGLLWIMKTGSPWRDLPAEFGAWQTVYKRFSRWAKSGIWDEVLQELSKDADWEAVMIDGSFVKLHQHGAGAKGGTSTRR